jgi:hypothetical protein
MPSRATVRAIIPVHHSGPCGLFLSFALLALFSCVCSLLSPGELPVWIVAFLPIHGDSMTGEDGPFALRLVCRPPWANRVLVGALSPVTCVTGVSSLGPFAGICWWLSVVFAGLMCGEPGWPKGS